MNTYTNVAASTAAVANRYVTSTNMKLGAYTLANTAPAAGAAALVTVTHTAVGAADTLGTIVVVGKDLSGQTRTDTITPLSGTVATGTIAFKSITSITGAGWVIGEGNDTITVGTAAGAIVCGSSGLLERVVVNTTAAAAVVISDSAGTIGTLKSSIAEGTYEYDVAFSGFLKIATTSTNDLTIVHTPTLPSSYAMS